MVINPLKHPVRFLEKSEGTRNLCVFWRWHVVQKGTQSSQFFPVIKHQMDRATQHLLNMIPEPSSSHNQNHHNSSNCPSFTMVHLSIQHSQMFHHVPSCSIFTNEGSKKCDFGSQGYFGNAAECHSSWQARQTGRITINGGPLGKILDGHLGVSVRRVSPYLCWVQLHDSPSFCILKLWTKPSKIGRVVLKHWLVSQPETDEI